jgi:hypothetical protein
MDLLRKANSIKQFTKACKAYRRINGPIQDDVWIKCFDFINFSLEENSIYQFVLYKLFRVPECTCDDIFECTIQFGFCRCYAPTSKKEVNRLINIYKVGNDNIKHHVIKLITSYSFAMERKKIITKPLIRAMRETFYSRRKMDVNRALRAGYHVVLEFEVDARTTPEGIHYIKYRNERRILSISSVFPKVLAVLITEYVGI